MATNTGLAGLNNIKIRTDYVPKAKRNIKAPTVIQICPRCRRGIPASEMDEHVRIELLDPQWRENRARAAEKQSGTNLSSDSTVSENLKRISAYRLDIFDGDEATTQIKVEELRQKAKEKEDKVWDGHSTTIVSVQQKAFTAGMAEIQATIQKRLREEEEREKIGPHVPKPGGSASANNPMLMLPIPPLPPGGLMLNRPPMGPPMMPPPMGLAPPPPMIPAPPARLPSQPSAVAPVTFEAKPIIRGRGAPPPPPPVLAPPSPFGSGAGTTRSAPDDDLPSAKRAKTEPTLSGFIPEDHFIRMAKGAITVQVRVIPHPTIEKHGWKVPSNPHTFMRIPGIMPGTTVDTIKEKIADETGWPPSRQKLTLEERTGYGFHTNRHVLKDSLSAAYYNLAAGDVLELTLKERGGKK
ncbi:hypothetical protein HDU97_004559 [Phlyctochytrium planicorne]|nr:hypothetical protein HDU97_004559 [Phlyctochytrium planicorne]